MRGWVLITTMQLLCHSIQATLSILNYVICESSGTNAYGYSRLTTVYIVIWEIWNKHGYCTLFMILVLTKYPLALEYIYINILETVFFPQQRIVNSSILK